MQASMLQHRQIRPFQACRPSVAGRRTSCVVNATFSTAKVLQALAKDQLKPNPPDVQVGDSVRVGVAVVEGKGKTRTQKLEGIIIATHGYGIDKTVKFRRIFQGVGVELTLPIHAPAVREIDVIRSGKVRRAKLFYLRDRIGKAARLKEVARRKPLAAAAAAAPAAPAADAAAPPS